MKRIVQYLYTGKTQIRADELTEFFQVAKQLEIIGLYNEIEPGDLSVVSSAPGTPDISHAWASNSWPNDTTSSEPAGVHIGRQGKRKSNANENRNGDKRTHKRARKAPEPDNGGADKHNGKGMHIKLNCQVTASKFKK